MKLELYRNMENKMEATILGFWEEGFGSWPLVASLGVQELCKDT